MSAMNIPASTSGPTASNSGSSSGPIRRDRLSKSRVRFFGFTPSKTELCSSGASRRESSLYEELQQVVPGVVVGASSQEDTVRAAIRYIKGCNVMIEEKDRLLEEKKRLLESAHSEILLIRKEWEKLIMKCDRLLDDSDASEDESG